VDFFQEAFENSCPLWQGENEEKRWQPLQSLEKLKPTSAQKPIHCWDSNHQKSPRSACISRARILSIGFTLSPIATYACSQISSACLATGASAARVIFQFFPWTRASSTPAARASQKTPITSTAATSSSWPLKAAVTPSLPRSACSAPSRASTLTKSRSS